VRPAALRPLEGIQVEHVNQTPRDVDRRRAGPGFGEAAEPRHFAEDVDVAEVRRQGEVQSARERSFVQDERQLSRGTAEAWAIRSEG